MVVGLAATVGWFFLKSPDSGLHEVYVGIGVSMVVYVGVSLVTRRRH